MKKFNPLLFVMGLIMAVLYVLSAFAPEMLGATATDVLIASVIITCPLPAEQDDIGNQSCQIHLGQIVRLIFQRTAGTPVVISAGTPFSLAEAEVDLKLAAVNDDKIQFSPVCENVVIPATEPIYEGGDDNTTLFGQQILVGRSNITVSGRFRGLDPVVRQTMLGLISESSNFNGLGVFLVDEFNRIWGHPETVNLRPIPINSFFLGDPGSEGYNTHTFTQFSFNFIPEWSYDTVNAAGLNYANPTDFDPLTKTNP